VYAAAAFVLAAWAVRTARKVDRSPVASAFGAALMICAPLSAGLLWTRFGDSVKALNPLTAELTSSAISTWNFGTVALRLSPGAWATVALVVALLVLGPATSIACCWCAVRLRRAGPSLPPAGLVAALAAGAIAGPAVFTNLYVQHDYYAMAGGVFIILLAAILFGDRPRPLLLTLLVTSNLLVGGGFLLVKQANYDDPLSDGIVRAVDNLPPNRHLVVFGSYMDSKVPYLTGQKAIQTRESNPNDARVREVLDRVRPPEVGVVLTRKAAFEQAARRAAGRFSLDRSARLAPGVWIFYASEQARYLDLSPIDLAGEYQERMRGFDPATAGFSGVMLPSGPDQAPLGIGMARRGSFYLFDTERGLRVVHRRWAPNHR
jgi:hypothetical protein